MPRNVVAIAQAIINKQMPGFRIVNMPAEEIGYTAGRADRGAIGATTTDLRKLQAKYGRRPIRTTKFRQPHASDELVVEVVSDRANTRHLPSRTVIISLKDKVIVGAQG